jgi:hypothetical protein
VARPSLRLLHDSLHTKRLDNRGNIVRLMSYDGNHRARLQGLTGTDDVFDERAPAGAVQNLGQRRLESRPFTGSQNYNSKITQSHS